MNLRETKTDIPFCLEYRFSFLFTCKKLYLFYIKVFTFTETVAVLTGNFVRRQAVILNKLIVFKYNISEGKQVKNTSFVQSEGVVFNYNAAVIGLPVCFLICGSPIITGPPLYAALSKLLFRIITSVQGPLSYQLLASPAISMA